MCWLLNQSVLLEQARTRMSFGGKIGRLVRPRIAGPLAATAISFPRVVSSARITATLDSPVLLRLGPATYILTDFGATTDMIPQSTSRHRPISVSAVSLHI